MEDIHKNIDSVANYYQKYYNNDKFPWIIIWRGRQIRNKSGVASWKTEKEARNAFCRLLSDAFIWDYVRARGDAPGRSYDTKKEMLGFMKKEEESGFLSFCVF